MAKRYGTTPWALMRDMGSLGYNLTVYRTARAARQRELERAMPVDDPMGLGRIIALLSVIADD